MIYSIDIAQFNKQRKELAPDQAAAERLVFKCNDKAYAVELAKQKTGFGEKYFFVCPSCGARRTKLYTCGNRLLCRECGPYKPYKGITHTTPGGERYIRYKMARLMQKNGLIEQSCPFDYLEYLDQRKPRGRWDKFRFTLKRLQALETMRFQAILYGPFPKATVDAVYQGTHPLLKTKTLADFKKYFYRW